jgi:hypothetical protein
MEGKKVKIHLHTPILVASPQNEAPSHYEQAIQAITGKVRKATEAGVIVEVSEFTGERGESFLPPYAELFLPHHKIDHIYIL